MNVPTRSDKPVPVPSSAEYSLAPGEFINYIACDTLAYQKRNNNKAVKKTLSIPEWLNEAAIAASQTVSLC